MPPAQYLFTHSCSCSIVKCKPLAPPSVKGWAKTIKILSSHLHTVFTVKPHRIILLKVSYKLSTTVLGQNISLFNSTVCKQCLRGQTLLQNYHFNITAVIALQRTIAAFCICRSIYEFGSGYISLTPSISFIKIQTAGMPFGWKTNKGLCLSLLPLNITKSLFAYTIGSIVLFHVPFT